MLTMKPVVLSVEGHEIVSGSMPLPDDFAPRQTMVHVLDFPICIIASKARLAAARSGSAIAAVRARGVICHDRPHLSLHQPQALS